MFDAYKVAVKLSLVNHVSSGLLLIAGQMGGLHKSAMQTQGSLSLVEKKLHDIKMLGLIGGGMAAVGFGGLAMLKGPYEEAKKLAQAKANFETMNLSASENALAFGKAASMSHKILGTNITENVKLIHDLHTAFGDLHHAVATADTFSKMSIVAKVANGGKDADGIVNAAAKALEHRGGKVINNSIEFEAESELMTKVMLATKMRVSPKDYLTASGTGKMAYQMMDKEYLYGNFAGMMAINGAARTGTETMTSFSSLIGGHMDSKGKGFLADLGLWQEGFSKKRLGIMHDAMKGLTPEERKVAIASMGGQAVVSGGLNDADAELFAHRPDKFIAKMIPLVRKRFGLNMTDDQIALMVSKNLNRSTGNNIGTQITMASKLAKDTEIINKTMGIETAYQHYMRSPDGAENASVMAWKNLETVIGSIYIQPITNGLLWLAKGLDSLSSAMTRHPTITKMLVYGFIALAGAMAFSGTLLLLRAGFSGLALVMPVTMSALSAAFKALNPNVMSSVSSISKLSLAVGVASAGFLGWELGSWFSKAFVEGTKFSDWLGSFIAHTLAFFGNSEAKSAIKATTGKEFYQFGPNSTLEKEDPSGYYGASAMAARRVKNSASIIDNLSVAQKPVTTVGAPPQQAAPVFKVENKMDKYGIATMITQIQGQDMSRPPSGPRGHDGNMSLSPVGLGFVGM